MPYFLWSLNFRHAEKMIDYSSNSMKFLLTHVLMSERDDASKDMFAMAPMTASSMRS